MTVCVSDTGIGIPIGELGRVFDLFSQVRAHQGRSEGGLGIGLALVKTLVGWHGGSVQARSRGPGFGSTFVVQLPRIAAPSLPVVQVQAPTGAGQRKAVRVLVVDDNVDAAESLAGLLDLLGHETAVAHDGVEALKTWESFAPVLVFLDLGMPVMDGFAVARRIRASEWRCDTSRRHDRWGPAAGCGEDKSGWLRPPHGQARRLNAIEELLKTLNP